MEQEMLEIVLTQVLEGQREADRTGQETTKQLEALETTVTGFDKKLEQQKVVAPQADTKAIEKIVDTGVQNMTAIVEAQPKTVVHKRQFLLFPETNTDYYYRMVFGRLIPWIITLFLGFCGLSLLHQLIQDHATLSEKQAENAPYLKPWHALYNSENESRKKYMDRVWYKANDEGQ